MFVHSNLISEYVQARPIHVRRILPFRDDGKY